MLQTVGLLAPPKSSETQNRPRNSGPSQLDSFFRQSYSEPINACRFQPPRAFQSAMAVRVCFDRSHDTHVRAGALANHAEVIRERVKIDLRPGWTSKYLVWHD